MTADSTGYPRVFLLAGRDRRVAGGHPWAYSNEIRMDAEARALPAGALVTLHRVDGRPFGVGMLNPHALIAFRMLDRDPAARIDGGFLENRLRRALRLRERLFDRPFYRWVHAEADGLPGLVVDRFADVVVVQANTAGMELLAPLLLAAVERIVDPSVIVLRNDSRTRALEGLPAEVKVARGMLAGGAEVMEGRLVFPVDVLAGQKTGWFYDQRRNRGFVATLASGGRVLDVFCHTGAFAIAAAAAGATEVLGIDSSEAALRLARDGAERNSLAAVSTFQRSDAFDALQQLATAGERYQVVVADPPAFVKSKKDLASGLRGYRKLARLAAALVEPQGFLFLASCSHNVEAAAFLEQVREGLSRLGRSGRILRAAGAGADHPVHPHLPETAYLKTLTLQLD
jgi:23S rRNA (cytosine1962-C5)-methyltransferase